MKKIIAKCMHLLREIIKFQVSSLCKKKLLKILY